MTVLRRYLVFPRAEPLATAYDAGDLKQIVNYINEVLSLRDMRGYRITLPSNKWKLVLKRGATDQEYVPTRPSPNLIIAVEFLSSPAGERFDRALQEAIDNQRPGDIPLVFGIDIGFHGADGWCPDEAADPIFGNRKAAQQLIHSDCLNGHRLTGRDVNVVIVDEGIDASKIPENYAGGWASGPRRPGTTQDGHGMMIVRNVLALAPGATIFDCPLLPPHISNAPVFASDAHAIYERMITDINFLRPLGWFGPSWVFVNAWALYDRTSDPNGDYSNNPYHPFNVTVANATANGIDVVFCAGNCGEFCPKSNCGLSDRGPGRSINGANSLAEVLTAGAVRTDGMWLGYSSQGPGQPRLAREKPDLCAPSQFCETHDAHARNTGTSAACALAAGVIAALRSRWDYTVISPEELLAVLRQTARREAGAAWNGRLGYGILDAMAAFKEIKALYPSS